MGSSRASAPRGNSGTAALTVNEAVARVFPLLLHEVPVFQNSSVNEPLCAFEIIEYPAL